MTTPGTFNSVQRRFLVDTAGRRVGIDIQTVEVREAAEYPTVRRNPPAPEPRIIWLQMPIMAEAEEHRSALGQYPAPCFADIGHSINARGIKT